MSSSTFGLVSLCGEHQAVCSWKCFCGLARCLSALPGTRHQWSPRPKSGRGAGWRRWVSRLPLGALKSPADPPDWWSAVTDTLGWKPWRGRKRKLRSVQACGEGKRGERMMEMFKWGVFLVYKFFLKKKKKGWNANFNRVSRGLGKQRWTHQIKNTVSDICAALERAQGKRRSSVSKTIQSACF